MSIILAPILIWRNVLTYTMKHKEQSNTSAFARKCSSGARREIIIPSSFIVIYLLTHEKTFSRKRLFLIQWLHLDEIMSTFPYICSIEFCQLLPSFCQLSPSCWVAVLLAVTRCCAALVHSFQIPYSGKIQGDGRKFLDHFKSYFGSQISLQSLNEIHICQLQPKSATKGVFSHIYLSLIVSSSWCMLPFDVDLVFQYQCKRFLCADFGKTIVLS